MTPRRVVGFALAGLGAGLLALAVVALVERAGDREPPEPAVGSASPLAEVLRGAGAAAPPFDGDDRTEAMLGVGSRCLRVAVADDDAERVQGLRGVRDLGPYDGMLFVFAGDVRSEFTMADTLIPLDIGFYDAEGREVDRRRMQPCPEGDDGSCPRYGASAAYRVALEVPAGELAGGPLGPCV